MIMGGKDGWDAVGDRITAKVREHAEKARANEMKLPELFAYLEGNAGFREKRERAKEVLRGDYEIKNQILAKLLIGPLEFGEVVADKRDIIPVLIDLFSHKNVNVRVKIAQVFGERGDERALPALFNGLCDEKYQARHEFANALAKVCGRTENVKMIGRAKQVLEGRRAESLAKGKNEFSIQLSHVSMRLEEVRLLAKKDNAVPLPLQPKPTEKAKPDTTERMTLKPRDGMPLTLQPRVGKGKPDTTLPMMIKKGG
jgi:hypothetical protein